MIAKVKNKILTNFNVENFILFVIFITPFMDLIASEKFDISLFGIGINSVIRGFLMIISLILFLRQNKSKLKNISLIYFFVLFIYCIGYCLNIFIYKDSNLWFSEFNQLIKFLYFPFMLVCFFNFFHDVRLKERNISKPIVISNIIYLLFLFIPLVTNSAFSTYSSHQVGYIGWFNSPNEIGAILAIISPYFIYFLYDIKSKIIKLILTVVYVYLVFSIATKTPIMGVVIALIGFIAFAFINRKKNFKKKMIFVLFFSLIFVLLFIPSNLNKKMNIQNRWYDKNIGDVNEKNEISDYDIKEFPDLSKIKTSLEDLSLSDIKTNKIINMIFSSRDRYIKLVFHRFQYMNVVQKLFGMGYHSYLQGDSNYKYNIVEIDYIDLFFCLGFLGVIIFVLPLFVSIVYMAKKIFRERQLNEERQKSLISIVIALLLSFLAGHVLIAPSPCTYFIVLFSYLFGQLYQEEGKIKSIKRPIVLTTILGIGVIGSLLFILFHRNDVNTFNVEISKNKISFNNNFKLVDKDVREAFGTKDYLYCYEYQDGKLLFQIIYVHRLFSNNDYANYITINNRTENEIHVNLSIDKYQGDIYWFKNDERTREFSKTLGQDNLGLPISYIESKNKSVLIGKTFHYTTLTKTYDEKNISTFKNLIEEDSDFEVERSLKNITVDGNTSIDTYFIHSPNKLFEDENSIRDYIDIVYTNSIDSNCFSSYNGNYYKLPYSIEPFSKDGYGRNVGAILEKQIYELSHSDNSSLFDDLVDVSIQTYYEYLPQDSSKVWITEYTSTWLKNDYLITSYYVDTRHNENVGLYLYEIGVDRNNKQLINSYYNYADYLLSEYKNSNLLKYDVGILFPDYFSKNHIKKTHASLNHQLGIINYLFDCSEKSDDKEYFDLAKQLLDTITNIGNDWIREDKDLWYRVNNDYSFEGRDYETVTLRDLLETRLFCIKFKLENIEIINELIESKYGYLKDKNIAIDDEIMGLLKDGDFLE